MFGTSRNIDDDTTAAEADNRDASVGAPAVHRTESPSSDESDDATETDTTASVSRQPASFADELASRLGKPKQAGLNTCNVPLDEAHLEW